MYKRQILHDALGVALGDRRLIRIGAVEEQLHARSALGEIVRVRHLVAAQEAARERREALARNLPQQPRGDRVDRTLVAGTRAEVAETFRVLLAADGPVASVAMPASTASASLCEGFIGCCGRT